MQRIIGAGICAILTTLTAASAQDARTWSHKDWSATQREDGRCAIWTGGDGAGSVVISMDPGGFNASAEYIPVWYRSEPMPLEPDDYVVIYIDGQESWLSEEMGVFDGTDDWGDPYRAAGMTGGLVPEFIGLLRPADTLDFSRQRGTEDPLPFDSFSLAGFTAALMKTAEWCKFNPKLMPES